MSKKKRTKKTEAEIQADIVDRASKVNCLLDFVRRWADEHELADEDTAWVACTVGWILNPDAWGGNPTGEIETDHGIGAYLIVKDHNDKIDHEHDKFKN